LDTPIISFKTLCEKYSDSNILITTRAYIKEIREQLKAYGLHDMEELIWLENSKHSYYGIKYLYYPSLLKRKEDVE